MTTTPFPVPPQVDRLQRTALMVGVAGLLASVLGALFRPDQFFRSYLFGYLFWSGIAVGCLSLIMIHHLTGGIWGLLIRRFLEAGSRTVPLAALLFLPLAFGLSRIYLWAKPEAASDPLIRAKQLYLNVPFFLGRALFYFAVWAALAHFLSKWSRELDEGMSLRAARRLRGLSGGGLILLGLTITFSAVDWGMSLNPHWFSTVYGLLFMVGQVLSTMALVIVLLSAMGHEAPLAPAVRPSAVHDLGKLMLAFVMLWAYIGISQFLIIWSANLPEEIPWYIQRLHGGWQWVALALVVFHFALPFLLLLSRDLKRDARLLGRVAAAIFVVRLVDLFWLVGPDLQGGHHGAHLSLHWMDLTAPIGIGGIWLAAFARQLKSRPLLPRDPELDEFMAAPGHGGGH
jgi:hypothetical protein